MLKKTFTSAVLPLILVLCGCSSSQIANTSASSLISPALGVAGAAGGLFATEGESQGTQIAVTSAAAAGGYLLGQFIEYGFRDEKKKEFRAGYDLGRSNSSKELYWLYQKLHQAENGGETRTRLYELPVQYPDNGVKHVPDSILLPVVE